MAGVEQRLQPHATEREERRLRRAEERRRDEEDTEEHQLAELFVQRKCSKPVDESGVRRPSSCRAKTVPEGAPCIARREPTRWNARLRRRASRTKSGAREVGTAQ